MYLLILIHNNNYVSNLFRYNSAVFKLILSEKHKHLSKSSISKPKTHSFKNLNSSTPLKPIHDLNSLRQKSLFDKNNKLLNLFRVFIKFSLFRNSRHFTKQDDSKFHYSSPNSNSHSTSLTKAFSKWKNFYYVLFNLSFYGIKFLTFSNSLFTKEIQSLNWTNFTNSILKNMWRFVEPFLFCKVGQIVNYGGLLFRKLKLLGFNISLITDFLYQNKTIYYLKLNNYFIISLVSGSSRFKVVDLALPINSPSLFSQLFFIRFIVIVQRDAFSYKYIQYCDTWNSLTNTL